MKQTKSFPKPKLQLLLLLSCFSCVRLCVIPQTTAHQAPPRPWDSPGKNTAAGCHFLLQCMKVKNESEVAQSCLTLHDPMDCSLPGSSVHGIFQARVLEWGAIAFSDTSHYDSFNYLIHLVICMCVYIYISVCVSVCIYEKLYIERDISNTKCSSS